MDMQASSRVVSDPGSVASLIYVSVFLLVPGPVRFALTPLLLEEGTELARVGIDILTIFGTSPSPFTHMIGIPVQIST